MSMLGTMGAIYTMYCAPMYMQQQEAKDRKDELRKQWRKTMNLSRKAKKKRRKELLINWRIACANAPMFSW